MAKKLKSFSHVQATEALEQLGQHGTSASEFVYDLLRIFANWGDGQVRRTKDGAGNSAKDGVTVLVKNLIAYRPAAVNTIDDDCSAMYDIIESMRADAKITKHSPRLYVTSNGTHVVAYDPKENDSYENRIEHLWNDFEFFTPLAGIEKIQYAEEAEADVKSAELMAKLFDDIRRYNNVSEPDTVHALNVFMSRLLFCFFAEDTGLFPDQNLFTHTLANYTKADGSDLAEFIDKAFLAMSTNDPAVLATLPSPYDRFPYVNGGLFKERFPIPTLSRRARTLILNCGEYNWKDINPDIFGSMIQAVVTPEQRAGLGMHYTSVSNIKKVIQPLFLDSLIEEYTAACEEAKEKLAKKIHPNRATQRLNNLLSRLSNIKFFDPACGSGNFLIIAYKLLRELEIKIWQALRDIANIPKLPMSNISLTQFYGIELDEYACDTAMLSLWLAEHQMNVEFGKTLGVQPDTLPLKPSGRIVCGNACRLDWNTVCPHTPEDEVYIMGNPPYLGSKWQNTSQKEDVDIAMPDLIYRRKVDYIASWFYKASKYIHSTVAKCAFVSTNSICQGEQVGAFWPYILSDRIHINFCHTSFKWSNNAKLNAGVTCVIIGLSSNKFTKKFIYRQVSKNSASNINAYLLDAPDIFITSRRLPISDLPEMIKGSQPTDDGALQLNQSQKDKLLQDFPELSSYIKRYMGADDLINDNLRYCLWFTNATDSRIFDIEPIKERLNIVKKSRQRSSKEATRRWADRPWLFTENRQPNVPYLILPVVSSERRIYIPVAFNSEDVIANTNTQMIPNATLETFAIVSSYIHNLWMKTVCGRLELRYAYSANIVYNNYPLPKRTTAEKEDLERLAQNVLNIRDEHFDMTLGEMYNPETMPDELLEAHHQLDLAVERIYRPDPFTSDEERLEYLFKLYAKMTKK